MMEIIRYKYVFVIITLLLSCVNNEDLSEKSKPKENSANCPFSKIIEDIFKIHNKSSESGIYLKDNERAKIFINSIANITDTNNNYNKNNQEKLVNDIIASINRIKNNITSDSNDTKMNEAIILNVPKDMNKTETEKELIENYKSVGHIKSGMEEKIDIVKSNISTIHSNTHANKASSNKTTDKVKYVEILTIEPNNTNVNNISSHNILEVLKHLMPMFNSTLTKELHNITIIERNHNKNHSYSATKNVSTIVVTYCDKENLTKLNETFESGKESDLKTEKDDDDDDYYVDDDDERDEEDDDNPDITVSEKRDILEAAEYGMQKMHELYSVLEPKLYSMGLWLDDTNPARYVAAFNAPSEDSAKFSRYGYATLQAATRLKELTNGGNGEVEGRTEDAQFPTASALRQSPLIQHCPSRGAPKCPPASKRYRTHDGTCNNQHRPRWGSTMTPVQRFLSPSYSDGLQAPRRSIFGSKLPSAREISSMIHESQNVENPGITHLLMQWGQFVDHDVTSSSQSRGFNGSVPRCCKDGGRDFVPREFMHPECFPISVPTTDPFYGPRGIKCLDFVRSSPAPRDDCALGWREQLNQVSAYIDGSPLYASSARQSDKLRLFRNGMLQYGRVQQRRPILPPERRDELCRGGAVSTDCFKSGDARVNEHPGLVAAHIVWLRQHNRMAQELAHLNPHWSDEKIYQETRKIVGAMIQHITYREFLPIVLGTEVMRLFELEPLKKGYYKNYNPKINASPASSFGSAAFRFGHSLVQPSMMRYDRFHRPIHNNVSLHDELTNPSNIWSMGAVDRLLLGMVNQPIQKRDEFITEELTNHLFQTPHFDFGMDLAAINIQRGRDHGVPPYTMWREPCGLSAILEFEDLFRVMPARAARKLQALYRHVDDIDLFTGGMAERPVVGGLVGPTFACIIAQQFSNLRKGDRFWYENGGSESSFTPAQLQQVRRISFAQVLCHTLDTIDSVQPFVFLSSDNPDNDRISCQNGLLNNFDLSPWVEIDSESNNDISKSDDEPSTQKPKRTKPTTLKPSTTTMKSTTTKKKTAVKVNQRKQTGNSTKTQTSVKQKLINDTDTTLTDDTNTTLTVQKIDDKLDFRNKSRRYEDTYRLDTRHRPTKKYNDYNYDYDDDENVQSVQSVVVNNVPHRRPINQRPVITVTENIDKYTYLINYVPRPTVSWRQTTRKTHDRDRDRDIVKVTYQSYDDTYRRPNKPYYYNRRDDLTDTDTDNYRRNRPNSYTTVKDFHSSARSNDDEQTTTKIKVTEKPDAKTDSPTTENLYKLVTFGYVGTYRGNEMTDKDKGTDKKSEVTERPKHDTDKTTDDTDKTKHDPEKSKHDTDKTHDHDTEKTKHIPDNTNRADDNTKNDTGDIRYDTDKTKHDTISKDFMTDNLKSDKTEIEDKTNMKLSTFFLYETATKPYNNLNRPTRRNDDDDLLSNSNTRTKYYYIKNVLHKYSDNDGPTTTRPILLKNDDDTIMRHVNKILAKDTMTENDNDPGQVNIEERSSADKMAILDDIEAKASTTQKLRTKIKKPASSAKTPSVAFQVIPSENNPSKWAVYEEDEGLLNELTKGMPTMKVDPHALKEIPRPMNLGAMRRRRPGRF